MEQSREQLFEKAKKLVLLIALIEVAAFLLLQAALEQGTYVEEAVLDIFFYSMMAVSLGVFAVIYFLQKSNVVRKAEGREFFMRIVVLFALATSYVAYGLVFNIFAWSMTNVFDPRSWIFLALAVVSFIYVASLKGEIIR